MKGRDVITLRQYLAVIFVALFSPASRLLPKAVLEVAGISGWIAPVLAFLPLAGLIWLVERLLLVEGRRVGLAQALAVRFGPVAGRVVIVVYALWIVCYGGFLLRSGGERMISTVYPTAKLGFFLAAPLLVSLVAAFGKLRYAVRSMVVLMLLFLVSLMLVNLLAIPNIKLEYLWPVDVMEPGRLALSAVPVVNVLSPWVYFSFLRGRVVRDENEFRRSLGSLTVSLGGVLLLLVTTIGILGPELSLRQQFPFFVMIKNLTLFDVVERFEPLVVMIWTITDYVCVTMLLMSASEAFRFTFRGGSRGLYTAFCGAGMLAVAFCIAPDAFQFVKVSNLLVPAVNLCFVFAGLPLLLALSALLKKMKKSQKRC